MSYQSEYIKGLNGVWTGNSGNTQGLNVRAAAEAERVPHLPPPDQSDRKDDPASVIGLIAACVIGSLTWHSLSSVEWFGVVFGSWVGISLILSSGLRGNSSRHEK